MARRTVTLNTSFTATTSGVAVSLASVLVPEYYVVVGVPASAAQVCYLNPPVGGTATAGASQYVIGLAEGTYAFGPFLTADGAPKISTLASTQGLYVATEIEAS